MENLMDSLMDSLPTGPLIPIPAITSSPAKTFIDSPVQSLQDKSLSLREPKTTTFPLVPLKSSSLVEPKMSPSSGPLPDISKLTTAPFPRVPLPVSKVSSMIRAPPTTEVYSSSSARADPSPAANKATQFPSITGKIDDLISRYLFDHTPAHLRPSSRNPTLRLSTSTLSKGTPVTLSLIGTVKLHGTHADVVIYHDNTIRYQSRNNLNLTKEIDNHNFFATMSQPALQGKILSLRDQFVARYLSQSPSIEINKEFPVVIAGEWIGPGVQKGVAISKIKAKVFVIVNVSINGKWTEMGAENADVENRAMGIYHVASTGVCTVRLDLNKPEECEKEMMRGTLEIERECLFAKTVFGIEGVGEGIVWKVTGPLGQDSRYWLKTKGPSHCVSETASLKPFDPARQKAREEREANALQFAQAAVTTVRLEQGWDYLREMCIPQEKKRVQDFLNWLTRDVEREEGETMLKVGVTKKLVKTQVTRIGREWFWEKVDG